MSLSRTFFIGTVALYTMYACTLMQKAVGDEPLDDTMFPFIVSYDAPSNATNIAKTLPTPAGRDGFVRVNGPHFTTDAGPFRIWGTNLCFAACFPEHNESERIAARLARFGINCVRLHHMDSRHIWGNSGNHVDIDPQQINRLDYLIYQLKLHGVHVNINLHVSRMLDEKDGAFPHKDLRPKYDKGLDNFEPQMIELQKKYAKDLLTHVNPYTKLAYTDDPAVAMVEINNENALLIEWNRGNLDNLPDPYATTFRTLWNQWLLKKYGSTDTLRTAWNAKLVPLSAELLDADRLADDAIGYDKCWQLQTDQVCKADVKIVDIEPGNNGKLLRVTVEEGGDVSWVPQLIYRNIAVEADQPYTMTLRIRAEKPDDISLQVRRDHQPWGSVGLQKTIHINSQWTDFQYTFIANTTDKQVRIDLSSLKPNVYELSDISFRHGGITGLKQNQSLEQKSVPVLTLSSMNMTKQARADFIDFIWDTERNYWTGMYRYLKDELGVKSIVSGTQMNYGPAHVQAEMDYIDAHAYWNHPTFPNKPWDPSDWYLRDIALVNHMTDGTLTHLASTRVGGLPYTVSEYNHPEPNSFAAEGFPMMAAYGRLQRWDGVFMFTYSNGQGFEPEKITGYFDIQSVPDRMAHMIACSNLFLRGDADEAHEVIKLPFSEQADRKMLYEEMTPRAGLLEYFGINSREALAHAVELDMKGNSSEVTKIPETQQIVISDTKQLLYEMSDPEHGLFIAKTPRTIVLTGFPKQGTNYRLDPIELAIGKTQADWATVSITSIDGQEIGQPGRILVAATGKVQNRDMQIKTLSNNRITCGRNWGDSPVLCEGVPCTIRLDIAAERVRFYPLDESGNRRGAVPVVSINSSSSTVRLSPELKTIWYEIEITE